jgi:hypothetical protein
MDGDGCDELLGTWDVQGVYYLASIGGAWVKMGSPATLITAGDIDGDGTDDLIGIWPTQGGVWVKYSTDETWERLSSTARDITAGKMRAAGGGGAASMQEAQSAFELSLPMGGVAEGPEVTPRKRDLLPDGPGGARFVFVEDKNIVPYEDPRAALTRAPGPGEPGFMAEEQKNTIPGEALREKKTRDSAKTKKK